MELEGHIETLAVQHKKLEEIIATEMTHPDWDEARVAALKKQKLRIKDELERLRAVHLRAALRPSSPHIRSCDALQSARASSRNANFWIFPVLVLGSSVKTRKRGALNLAICSRQKDRMSSSVAASWPRRF